MTWDVPSWYALALLALAAYRVWYLVAHDTILDPIRHRLVRAESKQEEFLQCPYCMGFHVSLVVWLCWVWQPHWTLVVCTPLALSAILALIATHSTD